ncbi:MAG: hypothetical protein J4478_02180 [Candidatus Diapherotrites archaeon]|uniref:Uncharacterized protein n=1 Tax=Candidatus Iainarchaeum sp. TaxID=3101447 RepID=A0A7J4KVC5_9ARCH|nr:hypothetical protein [Candidatus Diapherotrites archaeon]HIH33069.1 hypothetical protein [Candidatus Diapherotrites archaeon]
MVNQENEDSEEEAGEAGAQAEEQISEEELAAERAAGVSELPFPRATITNKLRKHLDKGKQIKGQVKVELNLWLGKMIERIAGKMNQNPYSYVDGSMFREAIEPYENIQDIEKEKERIIKQLESIKAACDVLINEVDRKFVK